MKRQNSNRSESEFEEIGVLGKGSYGRVVAVRHKIDGVEYALKRVAIPRKYHHGSLYREVTMLAKLQHRNIIRYFGAWTELSERVGDDEEDEERDNSERLSSSTEKSISWSALGFQIEAGSSEKFKTHDDHHHHQHEDLAICAICNEEYEDWEVTFEDWNRLGSQLQPLSLCIKCYCSALKALSIDLAQVHFVKQPLKQLYLVIKMEMATATLKDCMNNTSSVPKYLHLGNASSEIVFDIMHQLFEGLEFLHQRQVVHRDIKPTNLFLILENGTDIVLKIGDLGLARTIEIDDAERKEEDEDNKSIEEGTRGVGSLLYLPPTPDGSPSQDIFASGIVLIELLAQFGTEMERRRTLASIHKHLKENGTELSKYLPSRITDSHPSISLLICSMLHPKSSARPTASLLLLRFESRSSIHRRHSSGNSSSSSSNLTDYEFKVLDEVRRLLLSRGLSPDKTIHKFSSNILSSSDHHHQ